MGKAMSKIIRCSSIWGHAKCCVNGCKNPISKHQFSFPKNVAKKSKPQANWLSECGIPEENWARNWDTDSLVVCDDHFKESDFQDWSKLMHPRLRCDAIPNPPETGGNVEHYFECSKCCVIFSQCPNSKNIK